ncbi:hypothetical protein N8D56_13495 [Devosia sp. A8/3-2]|nr:hypothetical protein N8D56_13495 [Devosia sp. A8/3-2]
MIPPTLFIVTFLLGGVALASVLVFGPVGLDVEWDNARVVGLACGLLSCGVAAWTRQRPSAVLVLLSSLAATVLAGPMIGFMLVFGLMGGLGALFSLAGARGESGVEGIGVQSLTLLSIATIAVLAFASQAGAIQRAYDAWTRP